MIKGEKGIFKCQACEHQIVFRNPFPEENTSEKFREPFQIPISDITEKQNGPSLMPGKKVPSRSRRVKLNWRRFLPAESLISRIALLAMCVSLIPLLAMSLFALHLNQKRMQSSIDKIGSEMTVSLLSPVEAWLEKNIEALQSAAKTPEMQSLDQKLQEQVLKSINQRCPWVYAAFTGNICGENIARSDFGQLVDFSEQSFYQDVMKGKAVAIHTFIDRTTKRLDMILAVPIKRGGEIIGFAGVKLNTEKLTSPVKLWKNGSSGFAFLVDENNKVLAHPNQNYVQKEMNMKKHPLIVADKNDISGNVQYFEDNNERVLGYLRKSRFGWKIAIQQSEKEAFAKYGRTSFIIVLAFLATGGIVFLIVFLSARAIVKPIVYLTQAAEQKGIAISNFQVVSRKDEIGALARAIRGQNRL
jgi:C4-dicarboxylate-specific signal transduction histidine kinase